MGDASCNTTSVEKIIVGTTCDERNRASIVSLDPTEERSKNEPQFSTYEMEEVLSDFKKLNFDDNKCFLAILNEYQKKSISLFNYVVLNNREDVIDILDEKCAPSDQEEFRKRFGRYLLEIDGGASYGKRLQDEFQFSNFEVEEVLSDFKKLNFNYKENLCEDPSDAVNYNNGWPADPLDKIANYYRRNKNIFLFNYVVLSKQKGIMHILDEKLRSVDENREISNEKVEKKKKFKERLGRYLLRICEGMDDGKNLLGTDSVIAFFDGCYVACKYSGSPLNHHNILVINVTKPEQTLETNRLFTEKIKRMESEKSELKQAKIYHCGKRIITVEKNEKQQRNYSFEKSAICGVEISWCAKSDPDKDLNCIVVLNVNSGQISVKKSAIDGNDVEPKDILELAKLNDTVLIGKKSLHKVLEELLMQQTPYETKKELNNITTASAGP